MPLFDFLSKKAGLAYPITYGTFGLTEYELLLPDRDRMIRVPVQQAKYLLAPEPATRPTARSHLEARNPLALPVV